MVLLQVFEAQASRSFKDSVFRLNPLSNRALLAATGLVLLLQAAVIYLPPLHGVFGTASLSPLQALVPLAAGLAVLLVVQGVKGLGRRVSQP